jgi:BlaI family penicillinase repressor
VARRASRRPTDVELEILKVLWARGPSTAGMVRDELARVRPIGYTTVQKMLQIMTEKRLVLVDKRPRAHIYRPRESRSLVVGRMVKDLLSRALDGSASRLLVHALEGRESRPEEIEQMRQLLDEMEAKIRERDGEAAP